MSKKFAMEKILYAKSLVEGGAFVKDAAAEIDISPDVLSHKLRALGVDTSYKGKGHKAHNRHELDDSQLISRYLSGESVLSLSKSLGVNRQTITRRLKEHHIPIRTPSESMYIRMARTPFEERRALSASAREAHIASIMSNARHYSRGPGELEISEALKSLGYPVNTQTPLDNGCIDITIGKIAIEIKESAGGSFYFSRKRVIKIRNAGMTPIFIGFTSLSCVSERLEEIIALVDFACRHPSPVGQHWVVRCRCYSRTGSPNVYDTSIERRTDNA